MKPIEKIKEAIDRKPNGDFVRRRRYKVSVVNLSSRATVAEVRGRKLSLWLLAAAIVVGFLLIWTLILAYTPVGNILPSGRGGASSRYLDLAARVDSAATAARVNDQYAQNLLTILSDTEQEPEVSNDTIVTLPLDSLIEAGEAERRFVQRFEAEERYNLSVLSPVAAEGMTFVPPMTGAVAEPRISDGGIPYLAIEVGERTPVSAIYRGTVLNKYFTTGRGTTVTIQHPNGFISQYSGLAECYVGRGDKLNAGAAIGQASASRYPFSVELWHNETPLPPQDYINIF